MKSVQVLHAPDFDLSRVHKMPNNEAAEYLFDLIKRIDELERKAFALRGLALEMVEERKLYLEAGYPSMNQWIIAAAPWSHGACHEAMRAVKEFKDVPLEHLVEMPRANILQLKPLSSKERNEPKTLEAAKTLTEDDFAEHLQARHPELHIQRHVKPTLRLTEPVVAALDYIGLKMGIEDRQGQLEALCIDFALEHQS
jgi:hypothetical protein